MPKKRKSRGRSKGSKGRSSLVQCSSCGAMVPEDKCKKVTRFVSFIDSHLAEELRKQGAYIPSSRATKYYCISCATHRHISSPRARDERRERR